MRNMKKSLILLLQVCAASIIALEVAIPPDPWKQEIVLIMVILISLKYDLPKKIEDLADKYFKK